MFKYYLMGKVYKNNYIVSNSLFDDEIYDFSYNPFIGFDGISCYKHCFYFYLSSEVKNEDILKEVVMDINFNNRQYGIKSYQSKYCNKQDYIKQHLAREIYFTTKHNFERYENFDTIETDIELHDDETIKIGDKSYLVHYKFNKDLKRHELYLDYEIRIEIDEELKETCEIKFKEFCEEIKRYNEQIKTSDVIIDERFKNYNQLKKELKEKSNRKNLFKWIKNLFK